MDSKGFPIPPQVPLATAEEKFILEKMELHIAKFKKLLREKKITQYNLNVLINFLRTQMTKLYGKNSEITTYFLPIRSKLELAAVIEKAYNLITQVEIFSIKSKK